MSAAAQPSTTGNAGPADKGLRTGTLGLLSSVVIGVSSTAPAYSMAATIGAVVAIVVFQTPIVMVMAFVPMLFIAYAYRELNRVAPDCGTTFTWATKAFGPFTGWMGGWGIVAADVIVMASLAQIAGSYFFQLIGAQGLAVEKWPVFLVGALWIILLTYVCYRGIEVSARFQFVMLSIEVVFLVFYSVIALVKVYTGHAAATAVKPALSWFNPFNIPSWSAFSSAILLAVFIYWGWDSAVSVNEETKDPAKTPGRAAVISTLILLGTYAVVSVATLAFAGPKVLEDNSSDVFAAIGTQVLGSGLDKILVIAVLTSAAASTQTTILPTARTTLSMAAYQAIPASFAKMHPRFMTPTVSTITMGAVSIAFYGLLAAISDNILADSASAVGLLIAFYYGMTGFASAWYFRNDRGHTARDAWVRVGAPLLGGLMLLAAFIYTAYTSANADQSYTVISVFGWHTGGIFVLSVGSLVLGVILLFVTKWRLPAFFSGSVLNHDTPIRVLEGDTLQIFAPTLPDAPSQEQTVIPPMSVEELRETEAEARKERREGD
jgi:amino acid transporter